MINHDLVIVGGGPAGMAAAVAAYDAGCKDVVVMVVVENNNDCVLTMNTGCAVTAKESVILSY